MMWPVVVVFLVVTSAVAFSFRPDQAGSWAMWIGLAGPYTALVGLAAYRLHHDGTLRDRLRFRGGDITIGILLAGVLLAGAWGVRTVVTPSGTARAAWIFRVLMQLGPFRASPVHVILIAWIGLAEELVWRGLVLDVLTERFGSRWGWALAALAYGAAHLPTVVLLADPTAGPNPLIVLAALGCGLFWSFTASRLGRLPPTMVSHIVFTYFAPVLLLPGV